MLYQRTLKTIFSAYKGLHQPVKESSRKDISHQGHQACIINGDYVNNPLRTYITGVGLR